MYGLVLPISNTLSKTFLLEEERKAVAAAAAWMLDTWGEYLVGCSASDGKIYEWQLGSTTPAARITNSSIFRRMRLLVENSFNKTGM